MSIFTKARGARPRHTPTAAHALEGYLFLASVGRVVSTDVVTTDPGMAAAVIEDACLRMAVDSWRRRRPARTHRRNRAGWRQEGAELCVEAVRVRTVVERAIAEFSGP
jgi:hypothetical protein